MRKRPIEWYSGLGTAAFPSSRGKAWTQGRDAKSIYLAGSSGTPSEGGKAWAKKLGIENFRNSLEFLSAEDSMCGNL